MRDRLFWIFAVIQAFFFYCFGAVFLYFPEITDISVLYQLTPSKLMLIGLIMSTVGIEYLIYSKNSAN